MLRYRLTGVLLIVVMFGSALSGFAAGFFKVGESAPSFTLTSVKGESVDLADLRGKVVVLGLFHICKPCFIQSTNLQKVRQATDGEKVAVIGVNSSGDSKADVMEFIQSFPLQVTYPYLIDPEQKTDRLYGGGRFIPNVYIIDQQGVIRWQRVGNMDLASDEVIVKEVQKLLAQQPTTGGNSL